VPSFTASAFSTSACRHTAISVFSKDDFTPEFYRRFWH
jgi:hypothetical protein